MAELDEILKRYTDPVSGSVHGATFVAVDGEGNDVYRASFGSRTIDRSEPLTPETLTWIASQSKLVTSVAVMQLVEKGLIGLDDDVREVVPKMKEFKVLTGFEGDDGAGDMDILAVMRSGGKVDPEKIKPKGPPIYEEVQGKITLRQLMSHTSGLPYDSGNPLIVKWSALMGRTDHMLSGKIEGSTHPLVYQPGQSWIYSPGLDWVGQVIEALTKQDLETYMQQNIWKPLNATHMTFHPTKHFAPNSMPPLHETGVRTPDGKLLPKPGASPWPLEAKDAIGGAGLYGTANDYIKLLSCLLQGGAPLLQKSSVDELFRPQIGEKSAEALRTAIIATGGARLFTQPGDGDDVPIMPVGHSLVGVVNMLDLQGRRKKGTVGWGGLPNLRWWVDRESGLAATLFTQVIPPSDPLCFDLVLDLEAALYRMKS